MKGNLFIKIVLLLSIIYYGGENASAGVFTGYLQIYITDGTNTSKNNTSIDYGGLVYASSSSGLTNITDWAKSSQASTTVLWDWITSQCYAYSKPNTGYKFDGWYTNSNATGDPTSTTNGQEFTVKGSSTNTIYAKFSLISYTVAFDGNGGTASEKMGTMSFTYGTSQNLTANTFTRTGYTFAGWNTQADGTGTSYSNGAEVINLTTEDNGEVTLYAQWTPITYTITYTLKGGTNASTNPSEYTIESEDITLADPTRTGYNFTGWTPGSPTEPVKNLVIEKGSTGDKTFMATWTPIIYYVRFNKNAEYAQGSMEDEKFEYDKGQIELTTNSFTRTGYTFKGWATSANGDVAYQDGGKVSNLASTEGAIVDLYAIWDKKFAKTTDGENIQMTGTISDNDISVAKTELGIDGENVLIYVDGSYTGSIDHNIVIKGSGGYTCSKLVVTDKKPINVPIAFSATTATYQRTITSSEKTWGTICLPFAIATDDNVQLYTFGGYNSTANTLHFNRTSSAEANTPAVFSVENKGTLNISYGVTKVPVTSSGDYTQGDFTFTGLQKETIILAVGTKHYYIAQNKFWSPTKNEVTMYPQRAYFQYIGSGSPAKCLGISDEGLNLTGVDDILQDDIDNGQPSKTYYNAKGEQTSGLQPGLNIVRMSNGKVIKIMIK